MAKSAVKRQIILDTETTGLDSSTHRIIEVGCIELENRRFTGNYFHQYINPERSIDEGALAIHGISTQFLADKPLFKEIADALLAYLEGAELVIHNAPFDLGFLDREFGLVKNDFGKLTNYCGVLDTLRLAREMHPGQRNNLDALCKRYKVDNTHRDLHGALKDAQLLGEIYLRMTGGQMHFNVSPAHQSVYENTSEKFFSENAADALIVLKASEEEQAQHQTYLKWLKEQGECVWGE